ncbi:MAG: hypothetical protein A2632_01835 [Candidatus Pacebacteria bacterium RIFCSPHIGHO2_01_FULL_46_16]|nr:MAG: hypothetical protein A2632_01835 [Candidatus Pacebacteria bacterium RIFCSPHIGHO2_01_FULL_46_16]OGJ21814.1 MAG: hypothetical protein A3J60_03025 [Candidatus Pacebacteria bacterium RIFCSPHIGHO2_02_FULL_46_9]
MTYHRTLISIYYLLQYIYHKNILRSGKENDIFFTAIKNLGGLYIKLTQFVLLNTTFLGNEDKIKFLAFYDQATFGETDIDAILDAELGESGKSEIIELEREPFAAGSFAWVFKAKLRDQTRVIIKVKKKDLATSLRVDFVTLKCIAWIYNFIYSPKMIDLLGFIRVFERTTYKELDYRSEVENGLYFYDKYKFHKTVVIPKTYPELSTDTIIVQEFIDGLPLTSVIQLKNEVPDYKTWLHDNFNTDMQFVLREIFYQISYQGLKFKKVFVDPHPGNVIVLKNNRFAFIDFGIADESPANKKSYYYLIQELSKKIEEVDLTHIGEEMLILCSNQLYQSLETVTSHLGKDMTKLLVKNYGELLTAKSGKLRAIEQQKKEDMTSICLMITKLGERYGIRIPVSLFNSLKSSSLFKSYSLYLEPNFHCTRDVYKKILETISEDELENRVDPLAQEQSLETSLENISEWTASMVEKDFGFYQEINRMLTGVTSYAS